MARAQPAAGHEYRSPGRRHHSLPRIPLARQRSGAAARAHRWPAHLRLAAAGNDVARGAVDRAAVAAGAADATAGTDRRRARERRAVRPDTWRVVGHAPGDPGG